MTELLVLNARENVDCRRCLWMALVCAPSSLDSTSCLTASSSTSAGGMFTGPIWALPIRVASTPETRPLPATGPWNVLTSTALTASRSCRAGRSRPASSSPPISTTWSPVSGAIGRACRCYDCNLDGSGLRPLVVPAVGDKVARDARNHPVGIAVDLDGRLLYWTQKGAPNAR